jgi:multisubunit Na+/H+ antiporter MnhF subunit
MANAFQLVLQISLAVHVAMLAVCVWRVCRGENAMDRLIAVDLTGTLIVAVLVLLATLQKLSIYIDVALGLTALGFVTSVALAKYFADQQMF